MPTSQFRIFSSADPSAPLLNSQSGSLVSLLDAVLVNGYGSKPGLGWTKPIPNDPFTSSLACWRQPSGSRMILYINDAAPTGSVIASGREAWACGYQSILGLTGSTYPTTGTGFGVFPHYSQLFISIGSGTVGSSSLWWRKTNVLDLLPRTWVMFGDAHTFYLFVQTNDAPGVYYTYWFGDIFSTVPGNDPYKCMIKGRIANQNNASSYRFDAGDLIMLPNSTAWPHFFAAGSSGGGAFSCQLAVVGDTSKNTIQTLTTPPNGGELGCEMSGLVPYPNPADGGLYVSPLFVSEAITGAIRGRIRGMYHACHPIVNFADGQDYDGTGEFAGKKFRCVKTGPAQFINSSAWFIEISDTVETNA